MTDADNNKIITRNQAIELGLKKYFIGTTCKHGHASDRYVRNSGCVECSAIRNKTIIWKNIKRKSLTRRIRCKEKQRIYAKNYRKKYPEKERAKRRKYYNPETQKKAMDKYRKANPEVWTALGSRRRARKKNAEGSYTGKQILALVKKQKNKCINCLCSFSKTGYHVDHIMPLAKGGSNNISNIQLLCPTCNIKKSDKDPVLFAQMNGRLL